SRCSAFSPYTTLFRSQRLERTEVVGHERVPVVRPRTRRARLEGLLLPPVAPSRALHARRGVQAMRPEEAPHLPRTSPSSGDGSRSEEHTSELQSRENL